MKSRHFRRPSAWTALRWTFRLSDVICEGFCDILREIDLAAWRVLYDKRLRIAPELLQPTAEEFWSRKLKNLLCIASSRATRHRLVTCNLHCIVVNIVFAVEVDWHQNISVFLTVNREYSTEGHGYRYTQPGRLRGLTERDEFRLSAPGNRSDAGSD